MENSGGYPGASGPHNAGASNKKLQKTQAQVDEVVGIMKINIEKVLERDQKLTELADQAGISFGLRDVQDWVRNRMVSLKIMLKDHITNPLGGGGHIPSVLNVVGIMRTNVAKVLERDEKLSELDQRADNLQIGASQFEQQASRLKRKYWWKNLKMMIIIGVICTVLLIVIFVSVFSGGSSESKPAVHDTKPEGSSR